MRKKTYIVTVLIAAAAVLVSVSGVYAQEEKPEDLVQKEDRQGREKRHLTKEELLKLKQENPEKFNELVSKKREQVRQRLEQIKQNDPEKYQKILDGVKQKRQERLEKLKNENPDKYNQVMERTQKLQELRNLRKEDPEKFKEYLDNHPGLKQRLEDLQKRRQEVPQANNGAQ
ncbi:MAG: hypothetical protein PHN57_05505 [Candidatus Omnitrophica bacterium]|nr:hypothetical protein [Candidatus Omnitrophota bacterium]